MCVVEQIPNTIVSVGETTCLRENGVDEPCY